MAQQQPHGEPVPEYSETSDPANPPQAVAHRQARRTAVRVFVGGIIVLFVIVGVVFAYYTLVDAGGGDDSAALAEPEAVGTIGRGAARERLPGGFDPAPKHDDTLSELEFRGAEGGGEGAMLRLAGERVTDLRTLAAGQAEGAAGRPVQLQDVEVVDVPGGGRFVIGDGDARATVISAEGGTQPSVGQRVNVSGEIESAGAGGIVIRASRVE